MIATFLADGHQAASLRVLRNASEVGSSPTPVQIIDCQLAATETFGKAIDPAIRSPHGVETL